MPRRELLLKWLAYGIALVVVAVLNYAILIYLPFAIPLLLPIAAIAAGTLEGAKFGAGHGIAAGILMASIAHGSIILIPVLAIVGWLAGLLAQYVLRRDLIGHIICCIAFMALWELAQVLFYYLTHTAPFPVLIRVALPELLWTLLFSFPVYCISRFCCVHYGRIYHE